MLGALQLLAILSCPHAEELFRTLSTAYAQMSGRNWLPRLRELSYQSEGQASTKLKDFKNFVSAFSGLELISVLYESRTMRDSRNTLLKQIIESHGATLKILVWQLRSCNGDMDGCGGREHFPLQDNLFEYIYTRCQLLEEISVVVDWPGRYHVSGSFFAS